MLPLYEQFRPREWGQVIGQDKVLRGLGVLRRRGLAGRAYFFAGKSGQGKTTIARLLAQEVCGPDCFERGNAVEVDAKGLTPAALQELERGLHFYGSGQGHGRAVIINEVHGLSSSCVTALLTILERPEQPIPAHALWIFTTTSEGQEALFEGIDTPPWLSRCQPFALTSQGLAKAFAERAREIAQSEDLDGKPVAAYLALANDCKSNFRLMLERIEQGEMLL